MYAVRTGNNAVSTAATISSSVARGCSRCQARSASPTTASNSTRATARPASVIWLAPFRTAPGTSGYPTPPTSRTARKFVAHFGGSLSRRAAGQQAEPGTTSPPYLSI